MQEDEPSQLGQRPDQPARNFLKDCEAFIMGSVAYARIAKCLQASYRRGTQDAQGVSGCVAAARRLLDRAKDMCDAPFDGAKQLRKDVEAGQRLLGRQLYESVTAEEPAVIKVAILILPPATNAIVYF